MSRQVGISRVYLGVREASKSVAATTSSHESWRPDDAARCGAKRSDAISESIPSNHGTRLTKKKREVEFEV